MLGQLILGVGLGLIGVLSVWVAYYDSDWFFNLNEVKNFVHFWGSRYAVRVFYFILGVACLIASVVLPVLVGPLEPGR